MARGVITEDGTGTGTVADEADEADNIDNTYDIDNTNNTEAAAGPKDRRKLFDQLPDLIADFKSAGADSAAVVALVQVDTEGQLSLRVQADSGPVDIPVLQVLQAGSNRDRSSSGATVAAAYASFGDGDPAMLIPLIQQQAAPPLLTTFPPLEEEDL